MTMFAWQHDFMRQPLDIPKRDLLRGNRLFGTAVNRMIDMYSYHATSSKTNEPDVGGRELGYVLTHQTDSQEYSIVLNDATPFFKQASILRKGSTNEVDLSTYVLDYTMSNRGVRRIDVGPIVPTGDTQQSENILRAIDLTEQLGISHQTVPVSEVRELGHFLTAGVIRFTQL